MQFPPLLAIVATAMLSVAGDWPLKRVSLRDGWKASNYIAAGMMLPGPGLFIAARHVHPSAHGVRS